MILYDSEVESVTGVPANVQFDFSLIPCGSAGETEHPSILPPVLRGGIGSINCPFTKEKDELSYVNAGFEELIFWMIALGTEL